MLKRYFVEAGVSQQRQFVDADTVFAERRRLRADCMQTRGGMLWRVIKGHRYLIRTSSAGAQKSLGPESIETRQIFESFTARKAELAERRASIEAVADEQRRLNRALRVGRVPVEVVAVLNALDTAGIADHFLVAGTEALYAYESACGVRMAPEAMSTRIKLTFLSQLQGVGPEFLGALKKADKTFVWADRKKEAARNAQGLEVRISRRTAKDVHLQRFSQMVVATNGEMALMHTVRPLDFVCTRRERAELPDREPLQRAKDLLQADLVEQLVREYMPQHQHARPSAQSPKGMAPPPRTPLERAAATCSVSFKTALTSHQLRDALLQGLAPPQIQPHVHVLLDEAPMSLLSEVVDQLHIETGIGRRAAWAHMRSLARGLKSYRDVWVAIPALDQE